MLAYDYSDSATKKKEKLQMNLPKYSNVNSMIISSFQIFLVLVGLVISYYYYNLRNSFSHLLTLQTRNNKCRL